MSKNNDFALPKTVRVGSVEYKVDATLEKMRDLREGGGQQNLWGQIDLTRLTICIDPTMAPARQINILLHELIHALAWEAGIDNKTFSDESAVEMLATLLGTMLRDNKELVDCLVSKTRTATPEST